MLCCGAVAVFVAIILGVWRNLRAMPRAAVAFTAMLFAAGPVAALTADASVESALAGTGFWALAAHSLCGTHLAPVRSIETRIGEPP